MKCYLDNAATTVLSADMKSYLTTMLDVFGNPSSAHSEGVRANRLIEEVRKKVANFINANSQSGIYFTSSGSASNALGIHGFAISNKCTILYSPTVHKSILKTVQNLEEYYNINNKQLKVDSCGNIDIDYLKYAMQTDYNTKLVVVDYANSEIGTIQNIKDIANVTHSCSECAYNKLFVDCTGSISTIPLNVTSLDIDIATFSGHKIGALKGVGVLYKKDDIKLAPLICGSQENGLFAGTENLLGILSLGKAIELTKYNKTAWCRDFVWCHIKNISGISLIGVPLNANRLLNNLYVCIENTNGNEIVAVMDDVYGTQISTGSACNNGEPVPSIVLRSIGINDNDIYSCIRISFNGYETQEELQKFCKNLRSCINILRGYI